MAAIDVTAFIDLAPFVDSMPPGFRFMTRAPL